jgi:trimeric autotransporter adhesin
MILASQSAGTGRSAHLLPVLAWVFASGLFGSRAEAQNVTVNPGAGSYIDLKSAFDAINAGTHTGSITVSIVADTTETFPAVLNASGAGAASYSGISITPNGARSISGAIAGGLPLIDFNGADYVVIDGLNSAGNSLTIANTTVSAIAGTSTIRFIDGAKGNTVTNANIQGSGTTAVDTGGATIFFSTDAVTEFGNHSNTISHNHIGPAGAHLPTKAIQGSGSSTQQFNGNSDIVIERNKIFDYFAEAQPSAGIATIGGCHGWWIVGNHLYQTGTRTWTSGALHAGVHIGSNAATGLGDAHSFTILGNGVGYDGSGTSTGFYTLTGAGSGARFVGILFNGAATSSTTTVNSNTVAGISMTGVSSSGTGAASPFTAILLQEGNIVSSENTIGSWYATDLLVFSTTTAAATDVYGIFNSSSNEWNAGVNHVGSLSVTNLDASGTVRVIGLGSFTSGPTQWNASGNTVGGIVPHSIQLTATGAASQIVGMFNSNAPSTLISNRVRNLTGNIGTGSAGPASVIGINIAAPHHHWFKQNTISNLTNTHPGAASVVTGLQVTGGIANVVERNSIDGLTSATTSSAAEINGIRVVGGTTTFRNNMIAVGADVPHAIGMGSTTGGINGILEVGGVNNIFHNSVYIGGAPSAGAGPSYAFASTATAGSRSVRNNIFQNARSNSGASGRNYAVRVGGAAANPAGLTIDNNVYFTSGSGAVFGFFNALDVVDLAGWRTAVGQDVGSFDSDPKFNDPTNATPDLHIHPTHLTVIEANGVGVGVTTDFEDETRASLTPVDIGADAGNFNGTDLAPPVISYPMLGNTASTSNRNLSATITDVGSGVPTAGAGLPVIYFRKGTTGVYASTQASLGGPGSYNFTIDYSLVAGGSVAPGDTIQYYVMAQDNAATPNVGPTPAAGASGFTASPPAAAMPPTIPDSYLISLPISGNKTVCAAGCDYTTLTAAGGAFSVINAGVATGNIDIQIAGDLKGEDGSNGLNARLELPAGSNFNVRIYPTGGARVIAGAFDGALIRMNGASHVTIDGSIGGNGADRSLTITNTSVTTPNVVLFGSIGTTPITNDTLRNSIIINGANTDSAVVIANVAGISSAGYFSDITIHNNDVRVARVGVYVNGGGRPQHGSNVVCTQNTLDASGADAIRHVGLYMQGVIGATISQNTMGNFSAAEDENDYGIWLASGTRNAVVSGNTVTNLGMAQTTAFAPFGIRESTGEAASGTSIVGNTIANLTTNGGAFVFGIVVGDGSGVSVVSNHVRGIINNGTGTAGAIGIAVSGRETLIQNNFVSDINRNMTGGSTPITDTGVVGIYLLTGSGHRVYFNSVNLFGPHTGTPAASLQSAAFSIRSEFQTDIDVRNNIFANNIAGGTTSIAHVSVYLPSGATSAMNLTWNNNAYYFGTDAARQGIAKVGTTAGTGVFTTLAALAAYTHTLSPAATNDDASHAATTALPFLSNTDLHIGVGTVPVNAGVGIAGVTVDIDGDSRHPTTPDIGADELLSEVSGEVLFLNGFEDVARTPARMRLLLGTEGALQSLVLPVFELQDLAAVGGIVDVIEFDIGNTRVLLQVRGDSGHHEARLLDSNGQGTWMEMSGEPVLQLQWHTQTVDGVLRVQTVLTMVR